MNRRKLFGWLASFPFVPAALVAKPAKPVLEPYYLLTEEGLWRIDDRTTELWTSDHSWYSGVQWSTAEQEVLKAHAPALPTGIYRDHRGRFTTMNMKYKPNLPEWF